MSHTNKTTHYNLPQFIGSDKASWLGDLNPAFNTIDGELYAINTTATDADSKADSAQASADNGIALAQQANGSVNELTTKLQSVAKNITFMGFNNVEQTCYTRYIKELGILSFWGGYTFNEMTIPANSVLASLNGVIDASYSTLVRLSFYITKQDNSIYIPAVQVSNANMTSRIKVDNAVAVNFQGMLLIDPIHFI